MWQLFWSFLWVTGMYLCHEFGLPQNMEKTFTFVQNILIGLEDNEGQVSIDRRIVAVLSSINAELDKWKFDFNYYCHSCYEFNNPTGTKILTPLILSDSKGFDLERQAVNTVEQQIKLWCKPGRNSCDGLSWLRDNLSSLIGQLDNIALFGSAHAI